MLAALDERRPGPVLARDIERVLEQSGGTPVYGPNPHASCHRLEDAGWLRTLCTPNLQLMAELTDAGRAVAQPLLLTGSTSAADLTVELDGITYRVHRGDFVMRLDDSTCLQLWNKEDRVIRREGGPLEVARWLQTCHDVGMGARVQINESAALQEHACARFTHHSMMAAG